MDATKIPQPEKVPPITFFNSPFFISHYDGQLGRIECLQSYNFYRVLTYITRLCHKEDVYYKVKELKS